MRSMIKGCMAIIAFTMGCGASQGVSDQDRKERQDLAFDVSGQYVEDAAAGTPSALTVTNEVGVHDIAATFELRGGLSATDRTTLKAAVRRDDPSLSDADVDNTVGQIEASLATLQLGVGPTFTERGGENICLDHTGDLAEIAMRHSLGDVARTANGTYDATVSLYLTGHRSSNQLDYETTPYTDQDGKGQNGGKGVLLTVTRTPAASTSSSGQTTVTVVSEQALKIGKLVKY